MTNTLAFVVITILSGDFAGEVLMTDQPVDCVAFTDVVGNAFDQNDIEVMMKCVYTGAPKSSPRPKARP